MADLLSALSEAGYDVEEGASVPESICAPLSATMGAAMAYEVWQRVNATGAVTAYDYTEIQMAAETITHAADHGDALAQFLYGSSFEELIERIESWVLDNLTADLDNVVELFASVGDFDQWEAESAEPTTTA
jgi:GTP cyclohydrolase III